MLKTLAILVLALTCLVPANADPAPAVTLAQILPTVQPPEKGVALIIGADKVTLPADSPAPPSGPPLGDCAVAFGMITRTFGAVTAVAPASMVVLNNYPGEPDLSNILTPNSGFQRLAASLSNAQWSKLTSASGLGLSDLDDDEQTLWWAMFPGRTLKIAPKLNVGEDTSTEEATDICTDLPQARIRVAEKVWLYPPRQNGDSVAAVGTAEQDGSQQWITVSSPKTPVTSLYGSQVRAEIANEPKPGDLKFNSQTLKVPIPLDGIKTVDDLVLRIGHATGLELYADPRFAARIITFLGPDKTAPAPDLLQSLALCVTGAFRAVGPAYVLTYDLTGLATTREIWDVYQENVNSILRKAHDQTETALYQKRAGEPISGFGDPLALSAQELAPVPNDPTARFFPWHTGLFHHPVADFTSGQQAAAKQLLENYKTNHAAEIAKNPEQAQNSDWKWSIWPNTEMQALAPSFPQPIRMSETLNFPQPPSDMDDKAMKDAEDWDKRHSEKPKLGEKPVPHLADLSKKTSHRAVLAAPRSPDEVKSLVSTMQKLGFNEMWLTVFADGQARIPGTPYPQPLDQKDDLLAAALAATQGTGIKVFPVADLLAWGQSPPIEARDMNVLRENSAAITAREKQDRSYDYLNRDDANTPPAGMWVSPFAPTVGDKLTALIKALASRPGIGGLIWRATSAPGYAESPDYEPLDHTSVTPKPPASASCAHIMPIRSTSRQAHTRARISASSPGTIRSWTRNSTQTGANIALARTTGCCGGCARPRSLQPRRVSRQPSFSKSLTITAGRAISTAARSRSALCPPTAPCQPQSPTSRSRLFCSTPSTRQLASLRP